MLIRHLIHKEIDKVKWDACIKNAVSPLVYACSWYLDVVAPEWEALVSEDYRYIMPLPVKKRLGFTYYIQPKFTQQLGIFSAEPISDDLILSFTAALHNLRYAELSVNFRPSENEDIKVAEFPNYIVSLNAGYEELEHSFSHNIKKNTRKALKAELTAKEITREEFFSFYEKYGFSADEVKLLRQLSGQNAKAFLFYGVYNRNGALLAVNTYLYAFNRYINLLSASSPQGMKKSAMFLLHCSFIKEKSGSSAILDFEGSRIENVAYFYKGFGSVCQPYYYVQKGKMPLLFRVIKKLKNKIRL